jgi:acetoacetyl-CoA synthetase
MERARAELTSDVVWTPDRGHLEDSQISRYLRWLSAERDLAFADYLDLWRWSTGDLGAFWETIWQFGGAQGSRGDGPALAEERMPGAVWFPGARVNYAENVLRHRSPRPALIAIDDGGARVDIGWDELAATAGALARTLRAMGVGRGDRVVAYVNNLPQAVVGLLATASLGAVWSICSPDFGTAGVLARFGQLRPKVLIAVDGYRFGGREFSRADEVKELVAGLPDLEQVIWIDSLHPGAPPATPATRWEDAVSEPADLVFEPVPFDHPLWVLYSSGTTGTPKGIIHGHGGIVLEHLKLMHFGVELDEHDTLLLLASTSWNVWNTLVSSLLRGATAVLLDGNPVGADQRRVWRVIDDHGVTVLGAGAGFLHATMKAGITPAAEHDLSSLTQVLSTGSPLSVDAYRWIPGAIGERVWINSCSGGTDVCSNFVGGCPLLPVRAARIQVPALGVAVAAWDDAGRPVVGRTGELVITRPMPSMPVGFWDDPQGTRYHDSYFAMFPGVWRHGDFIEFDPDGSSVIHGRSDSTLNRNGIRIGSAEIYAAVEALPEVQEALVVGVERGEDYYMPMFVALAAGAEEDEARTRIIDRIRRHASPRHVPDEIVFVRGIPHTKTGKKLEVPIKRLLQGHAVASVLDTSAIDAPELMAFYIDFARTSGRG